MFWRDSQEPVDSVDESDVLDGESDCGEHDDHGDEAALGNPRRADRSQRRRDPAAHAREADQNEAFQISASRDAGDSDLV